MTGNPIAEEFIEAERAKVTDQDVEKVVEKAEQIRKSFRHGGPLGRFVDDGHLLVSMVRDYWSRSYRQVPYATIGATVVALLYVLNPFDLVPDFLPLIGQVDDAAVIAACLFLVEQDLYRYRRWKEGQDGSQKPRKGDR